ncbi:hypothetical protein [Emticicia fontis]
MGFWSKVGDFLSSVGDAIADAYNSVKNWLTGTEKENEKTHTIYSGTKRYDSNKEYLVELYARQATDHMNRTGAHWDNLEKSCISMFEQHFLKLLNQTSAAKKEIFHKAFQEKVSSLKGQIKKYISSRYTADDPEFLPIIELDPGSKKDKELKKFQDSVQEKAVEKLCLEIKARTAEQYQFIKTTFEEEFKTKNNIYNKADADYKDLADKLRNPDYEGKKNDILQIAVTAASCDYVMEQLNI